MNLIERIRKASRAEKAAQDILVWQAAIEELRHAASDLASSDVNDSDAAASVERDIALDALRSIAAAFGRELGSFAALVGLVQGAAAALAEKKAREAKRFPVHSTGQTIPWSLVEPLRASCQNFHDQTLERLAERGGLSREELYAHAHANAEHRRAKMSDFRGLDPAKVHAWFVSWAKLTPTTIP